MKHKLHNKSVSGPRRLNSKIFFKGKKKEERLLIYTISYGLLTEGGEAELGKAEKLTVLLFLAIKL